MEFSLTSEDGMLQRHVEFSLTPVDVQRDDDDGTWEAHCRGRYLDVLRAGRGEGLNSSNAERHQRPHPTRQAQLAAVKPAHKEWGLALTVAV